MAQYELFELYVRGLPEDVSEVELQSAFAEYGEVIRVRIHRPDDRKGKGKQAGGQHLIAWVVYADKDSGERAISGLNGVSLRDGWYGPILTVQWSRNALASFGRASPAPADKWTDDEAGARPLSHIYVL